MKAVWNKKNAITAAVKSGDLLQRKASVKNFGRAQIRLYCNYAVFLGFSKRWKSTTTLLAAL